MSENVDLIEINSSKRGEIGADRATIPVIIEGAAFFSGQSALEKAHEVRSLAEALRAFGLEDSDIEIADVQVVTNSGAFSKSSAARYTLLVTCRKLENLPDILGIIAAQKNVSTQPLHWHFPDEGAWRDDWLDESLQRANERAQRMARGLKVRLIGVHRCRENWSDQTPPREPSGDSFGAPTIARAHMTSEDLGVEVAHTKAVSLSVFVQYRVSGYEDS